MRTRIKICGITRVDDGLAAARHGADAIGLVFYERSPRAVSIEQARALVAALPPFDIAVGLFGNPTSALVGNVLMQVPPALLPFPVSGTAEQCERYQRPYLKAVRMRFDTDLEKIATHYRSAQGLLLDTFRAGSYGGTGETFEWNQIPATRPKPIVLAGGLRPENIEEAVRRVRPEAVDVSGGVEAAKGVKDEALIAAFIRGVHHAERS